MKKLLLLIAVALGLAACSENKVYPVDPSMRPVFGKVAITPENPVDREVVSVRVKVSSEYGLRQIAIIYQLDGEEKTTTVGERRFDDDTCKSYDYEAKIPGQRAGSVVKFMVSAQAYYGFGQTTDVMEYSVATGKD